MVRMARYKCPPSLNRLFDEIDARWPYRDRRTDGWYTRSRVSYGHNAREHGLVHAIDVDKDGVNADWIVSHIYRNTSVLWYVIWNRHIWSNTYGYRKRPYTGSNPHTDHLHIEIRHTTHAENYSGSWGIAATKKVGRPETGYSADFSPQDYRPYLLDAASKLSSLGDKAQGYRGRLKLLRK